MDIKLLQILEAETLRQQNTLDLIASENYTSKSVRKLVGSVFMHKYAEGYVDARYYEGNENIDELEKLCKKMVFKVFDLDEKEFHVNVQVLSGAIANLAIYTSVLELGDTILSMYLPDGGHLSHGWSFMPESERKKENNQSMIYRGGSRPVSTISKLYKVIQYKTVKDTGVFDYDFIEELAQKEKPKLLISGGTAYVREIDYERMGKIAKSVGAIYLADVAHEAGLIAAKALSSPFMHADFVSFTTHKTLRGPRGAIVVCKKEFADKLDRALFPGLQGGPFMHNIAGITQALIEAETPEFKEYGARVIRNAKVLASELSSRGYDLMANGTDKHSIVIDLTNKGILGKKAAKALYFANITCNKTTVPYETKSPMNPSGIRLGTPSLSTRGMNSEEMQTIADFIDKVITASAEYKDLDFEEFCEKVSHDETVRSVKSEVLKLCARFPLEK